ncbi:TetR/AcrR family transcriptional regulator [Companilactobacillus mishanensis]|uniref:TetR/AcrR family transcriptional regulator n=1 Tax=Companilactobacillus mishanensis TaxID=2486008 RepID=A0A5P0ZG70_9LACO|nr:TetR/AcrR family transcriptional regulator [Companilactobacillus mishanensis]MQS45960.1 TetR/AcrR family transcriptional regulator [Companilactobacillus mishanensis]MQS52050.1 TetR/AcrR family transcriptional regulator [Companilactobacillus mishanensis]MQS88826.1 TetR/AcrR family transcriptional regulator [Companilactobacillus mishanensis]
MKKSDAKRNDILNVAQGMFYKKGYEATTTREINKTVGISDGSLYYYFPNGKREILDTIVKEGTVSRIGIIRADFSKLDSVEDLEQRLIKFNSKIVAIFNEKNNYQSFLITVRERNILTAEQSNWISGLMDENVKNLASGLQTLDMFEILVEADFVNLAEIIISIIQKSIYDELIIRNHKRIDSDVVRQVNAKIHLFLELISN